MSMAFMAERRTCMAPIADITYALYQVLGKCSSSIADITYALCQVSPSTWGDTHQRGIKLGEIKIPK